MKNAGSEEELLMTGMNRFDLTDIYMSHAAFAVHVLAPINFHVSIPLDFSWDVIGD